MYPEHARKLEGILERGGDDPDAILREAVLVYEAEEDKKGPVGSVLVTMYMGKYPHKRREILQTTIDAWRRHYDSHNSEVTNWFTEINIYRESTYISCWNRAPVMSLAMWSVFGQGREAVAIRSTKAKLSAVLERNAASLQSLGLEGAVSDVQYVDRLQTPDEGVHERIYEVITSSPDVTVGMFSIKPILYSFEQEVRVILYPKRDIYAPVSDPHPDRIGFALQIEPDFIEEVYVHPALGRDSMMVNLVKDVNRVFGLPHIPVIADPVEAFGRNINLPPREY